ncbi:MAG TPA: hypothetical protein VIL86_00220 [Tepidisphaeraceae bacterium]
MKRIAILSLIGLLSLCTLSLAAGRNAPTRVALNQSLPEMKFDNVGLNDAIDFLRDVSNANIHVNWRALEDAGIPKDTQINVRLRSVPMRKVLSLILSEASSEGKLTYYLDDGVIEITTTEIADRQLITRVYPIEDLIMEIPDFSGPDFNLESTSSTSTNRNGGSGTGTGSSSGSGSGGLFQGADQSKDQNKAASKKERADALVQLIMDTINPNIWKENGGPASIRFYNGHLIVTAPRSVHEAIGGSFD